MYMVSLIWPSLLYKIHTLIHLQVEATLANNPPIPVIEYTLIPIDTSNCQRPTLGKWCHLQSCVVSDCWLMKEHPWLVYLTCLPKRLAGGLSFKFTNKLHTEQMVTTEDGGCILASFPDFLWHIPYSGLFSWFTWVSRNFHSRNFPQTVTCLNLDRPFCFATCAPLTVPLIYGIPFLKLSRVW